MIKRNRRVLRAAVVTAVGVSALGLAATTASAKSNISFSAGPHNVRVGGQIYLTGNGDDDNGTFNRFCVQERSGHSGWHTLKCSAGQYNGGGSVKMRIRATHRGMAQYRGAMIEGSSPKDQHPKVQLTSRTFVVDVR